MPRRVRFTLKVDGYDRHLFSIAERSNGGLLIFFGRTERFGHEPDNPNISTQKYSVQESSRSVDLWIIEHTLWLANGTELSSSALTDAPKGSGFSFVFSGRPPNLSNSKYLIEEDTTDQIMRLRPSGIAVNVALVYSVLVGAPESTFGAQPGVSVIEFSFSKFKVIVLYNYIALPPYHKGDILHSLTAPAELGEDTETQSTLRDLMRGKDVTTILKEFEIHSLFLASTLAKHLSKEEGDNDLRVYLENISKGISSDLREMGQPLTLILDA
jgi:hypothetical protein